MTPAQHALYLACVATATYAQTMTGFAFGLVLLGLCGVFAVAPLTDVANVACVLILFNAAVSLHRGFVLIERRTLAPTVAGCVLGSVAGVLLLRWLSGAATALLQGVLGAVIVLCAFLLVARSEPLPRPSPRPVFAAYGVLSGILGGMFASPGPPLVYQFYRQPMPFVAVRNSLLAMFAATALLRLVLLASDGGVSANALWLSLEALPVVLGLTWLLQRRARLACARGVRRLVFVLLVAAGAGLIVPAVRG